MLICSTKLSIHMGGGRAADTWAHKRGGISLTHTHTSTNVQKPKLERAQRQGAEWNPISTQVLSTADSQGEQRMKKRRKRRKGSRRKDLTKMSVWMHVCSAGSVQHRWQKVLTAMSRTLEVLSFLSYSPYSTDLEYVKFSSKNFKKVRQLLCCHSTPL